MSNWINVCDAACLTPGMWNIFDFEDISILIFNINNTFYAIENVCTHDSGTLSDGYLEGDEMICPRHGAGFCVKNGVVTRPPAYENLKTFAVRTHEGKVQLRIIED